MKNRNQLIFLTTSVETVNKLAHTQTFSSSRPAVGVDSLSVTADFTGKKDTSKIHSFGYIKSYSEDYVGTRVFDGPSLYTRTDGLINNFSNFSSETQDFTSVQSQALADLYSKIRYAGAGDGLNLAVDIAEAHQVKKMLKDAFKLINFIRKFHPRQWANNWLEYTYGWKPLVNSIYGSFDAIMHRRTYSYVRVYGKGHDREFSQKTFNDIQGTGSRERVFSRRSRRAQYCCEFGLSNGAIQQTLGYTSLNPVAIAWELVPYSFVVDWLYDIGGYLENMESYLAFGTQFKRGWVSSGQLWEQGGYLFGSGFSGGGTTTWSAYSLRRHVIQRRDVLISAPIPRPPQFKADLGWRRLISGASLLSQHLGRR